MITTEDRPIQSDAFKEQTSMEVDSADVYVLYNDRKQNGA